MCWTGEQPTGAGQENIAGCAPPAAHSCAMQSPCQVHMGAAGIPQPSCHSPAKPRGLWWTDYTGQPGSASDTMPIARVCLTHSSPSKPPFPPQFRLLDLLPGPLVVPNTPCLQRISAQASLTPAQRLAPAPTLFLRVLDFGSPVLEKRGHRSYTPQGDTMALAGVRLSGTETLSGRSGCLVTAPRS